MEKFRSGARRAVLAAALGTSVAVAAFVTAPALAQGFPSRPLKIIVAYPAGTPTDAAARLLATDMQASLGQSVVVENRPGGDGATGVEAVARSAPDGYTLGIAGAGPTILLPALDPKRPDRPITNLAVVGVATSTDLVFVARPGLPVKSLPELVGYAKANPGKVKYATAGVGGLTHVVFEYLQATAHIELAHAPYKDDAPALDDLLAGRVDIGLLPSASALPQVQSGKLMALAIAGPRRSRQWPELPTAAEGKLLGYAASLWTVLVVPAGTPAPVIQRLNAALNGALRNPALADKLAQLGMVPTPFSVGQTRDFFAAENAKWSRVITDAIVKDPAAKGLAVMARAVKAPAVTAPAVKAPDGKTPAVKTPAVKTPAVKVPAVRTPTVKTPNVKTRNVKAPSVEEPNTSRGK